MTSRPPRALILSQFVAPEIGATQTRVAAFASGLAERGWEAHVIGEVPNHPQGVVQDGYRGTLVRRGRRDGYRASWVWVATKPEKSSRDRLAFYASYAGAASLWACLDRRPDVVLASSPPLPVGAAAVVAARRHRVPWVLDVRDLWPAAAEAVGELGDGRALRAARGLERFLYRDAAAITTVTEPFVGAIRALAPEARVELLPNGTTSFWLEAAELPRERAALDLPEDRFVWCFAGNVGLAQGLDTAIEAAGRLDERHLLVIVGAGAARPELERLAARVAPGRVAFRDQVPAAEAARYLRTADALLVCLAPHPTLRDFVPSKLFDCCATGRPVLLAVDGEARRLADEAGAALGVPAGDAEALAAAVTRLRTTPALRARLGGAGRAFAADNRRETQVERLDELLRELI